MSCRVPDRLGTKRKTELTDVLKTRAIETFVVSVAYLAAFYFTFKILFPLQQQLFPTYASYASLLFLPHGVRVLAAWRYGWHSVYLLAPGAAFANFTLGGWGTFLPPNLFGLLVGISCAALSFQILHWLGLRIRQDPRKLTNWRYVLLAGSVASLLNAVSSRFFYEGNSISIVAYLIGDISGLFFLMMILMLGFRWHRLKRI